ncbi:hypothetical protein FISHEDRAFT_25226, partial [Fistulina hepatica ATCC 64428]
LLGSLLVFYQQQQLWLYETRSAIRDILPDDSHGRDNRLIEDEDVIPDSPPASEQEEIDELANDTESEHPPAAESSSARSGRTPSVPRKRSLSPAQWSRRKKSFQLRLEGVSPSRSGSRHRRSRSKPAKERRQSHEERLWAERCMQLLAQYETLTETRMDSCHRLSTLVSHLDMLEWPA